LHHSINVAPISIIKSFVEINLALYTNNKPSYTPSHALFKSLWAMAKLKNRKRRKAFHKKLIMKKLKNLKIPFVHTRSTLVNPVRLISIHSTLITIRGTVTY
jgi:hypothetical protein